MHQQFLLFFIAMGTKNSSGFFGETFLDSNTVWKKKRYINSKNSSGFFGAFLENER